MVNCQNISQSLWDYIDGVCSPEEEAAIKAHLAVCPNCRSERDKWAEIRKTAGLTSPLKAPAFLWTRILAGIETQQQRVGVWWQQWRWMGRWVAALSLLVTLGVGAVVYRHFGESALDQVFQGLAQAGQTTDEIALVVDEGGMPWGQS
jgi:predicted anti-sigma-YlaC factor YlaD